MAAFCKRAFHLSSNHRLSLLSLLPSTTSHSTRHVNSNLKRVFVVDTLSLVRGLEAKGVPSTQAEAITSAMTLVLRDSLENVAHSFVSKSKMQNIRSEVLQESNISKLLTEMLSSQEHHFSLLLRETEKLRIDIEKMRSELSAQLEAAKYDVIKYCVGTLVSISTVGLAVIVEDELYGRDNDAYRAFLAGASSKPYVPLP